MDMSKALGFSPGDSSGYGTPQHVRPATDLSPHVDGGPSSSAQTNAGASADASSNLYVCAGIVIGAVLLLWLLGAVVFRSIRL